MSALLEISAAEVCYGDLQALFGVSLELREGEAVALIGANGAGKSTLLKSITGLTPCRGGTIRLAGSAIHGLPAERIARLGIAMVPEGRRLFPSLDVEENLRMGLVCARRGHWTLESVYELFPALRELKRRPATQLSGGQQQMVAIGRALLANPRVLLCDELSLGLAPAVVEQIYRAFGQIRAQGLAIVLVEQDLVRASAAADRFYCLLKGRVTLSGRAADCSHEQISRAYFGH